MTKFPKSKKQPPRKSERNNPMMSKKSLMISLTNKLMKRQYIKENPYMTWKKHKKSK